MAAEPNEGLLDGLAASESEQHTPSHATRLLRLNDSSNQQTSNRTDPPLGFTPSPAYSPWPTRPPSPQEHSRSRSTSSRFVRLVHEEPEVPVFCVISGGSGANFLVDGILKCCSDCHFVLPISDNGGSSSELIRCLGGPSIGDIRSRLIRLIPPGTTPNSPTDAIKRLLSFRLSATDSPAEVKSTWLQIVEGDHNLWAGIPADRREACVQSRVYSDLGFQPESVHSSSISNLNCSSGPTAASTSALNRPFSCILICRSEEESHKSSFSTITGIPERTKVIPCINTNSVATIVAELTNGSVIVGQNAISHPTTAAIPSTLVFEGNVGLLLGDDDKWGAQSQVPEEHVDATHVDKESEISALEAPISQIYYINSFGKQVWPRPNPRFITALVSSQVLIYSCGSLWTSIMPCLAIRGVDRAIAQSDRLHKKVLLLNAKPDRETAGMSAVDYITAIQRTLNRNLEERGTRFSASDYVTHVVYLENSLVAVDEPALSLLGIASVKVPCDKPLFDDELVRRALQTVLKD